MKNFIILIMTISILFFSMNVQADPPRGYMGGGYGYNHGYHGGYRGGVTNNYYNNHNNNSGSYWWIPGAIGLGFGLGYWAFGPPVQTPPPQTIIIQQPPAVVYTQPPPPQNNYWFYCQNPAGYYPHVPACPGGWMQVVPPR